jgi:hypothetical protein
MGKEIKIKNLLIYIIGIPLALIIIYLLWGGRLK